MHSAPVGMEKITLKATYNIKARILAVMHDDSLSREQKHCLAQAIYLERMHEEKKVKVQSDDGRNKRTFRSPGQYGCSHYKRNCRIKAECCQTFFTCRLCHDEECTHKIDRYATKSMLCMLCLTEQDVAAECVNKECGKRMAKYFCGKCRLFDDDYEGTIFHCDDCGLCRKAESDEYWHCKTCNTCLTQKVVDHRCLEHVLDQNCPVCNEYLFTSLTPITFPDCMHPMHEACMTSYSRTSSRCPICCRSLYICDHQNQQIDQYLSQNQMPEEYANHVAEILCNDCLIKSMTKFHFMYHKCPVCATFNTRVLRSGPSPLDSEPSNQGAPPRPLPPSQQPQPRNSQISHPQLPPLPLPAPSIQQETTQVDTQSPTHVNTSQPAAERDVPRVSFESHDMQIDTQEEATLSQSTGPIRRLSQQHAMEDEDEHAPARSSGPSFSPSHAIQPNSQLPNNDASPSDQRNPLSQQRTMRVEQLQSTMALPAAHGGAVDAPNPSQTVQQDDQVQSIVALSSGQRSPSASGTSSSALTPPVAAALHIFPSHTTNGISNLPTTSQSSSSGFSAGHFTRQFSHSHMSDISHQNLMFSAGHVATQAHVTMAHRLRESRSPVREVSAPVV